MENIYNDLCYDTTDRIIEEAIYTIENNATVRQTATAFEVSRSTVHKDLSHKLKYIDGNLYDKVQAVLQFNKKERARRGGQALKKLFDERKKENNISK